MHRAVEFYCEKRIVRRISDQKIKVRLEGERIKLGFVSATAFYQHQIIGKAHLNVNVIAVRRGDLLKLARFNDLFKTFWRLFIVQ